MDTPHSQEESYISCPSESDGSEDGQVTLSIPWTSPLMGISAPVIGRVDEQIPRLEECFWQTCYTIYAMHQSHDAGTLCLLE